MWLLAGSTGDVGSGLLPIAVCWQMSTGSYRFCLAARSCWQYFAGIKVYSTWHLHCCWHLVNVAAVSVAVIADTYNTCLAHLMLLLASSAARIFRVQQS